MENQNKVSMELLVDKTPTVDDVVDVAAEMFAEVFDYELEKHEGILLL